VYLRKVSSTSESNDVVSSTITEPLGKSVSNAETIRSTPAGALSSHASARSSEAPRLVDAGFLKIF
jgi:hypothetical protein